MALETILKSKSCYLAIIITLQQAAGTISKACRDELVSRRSGTGTPFKTMSMFKNKYLFNVTEDLKRYTGLSDSDLARRLTRRGSLHFAAEHAFWEPTNPAELRWYYLHSVSYLFANAAHATNPLCFLLSPEHGPVLDFSGGVGNNVLYLAQKGVQVTYTGIGQFEFMFTRHRVRQRSLEHKVEFAEPYNAAFELDPLASLHKPQAYGCIMAFDVLEHIPHFERTVAAMVAALRPGGMLCESSPFAEKSGENAIHVTNGGISMQDAMGRQMRQIQFGYRKTSEGAQRCWEKYK